VWAWSLSLKFSFSGFILYALAAGLAVVCFLFGLLLDPALATTWERRHGISDEAVAERAHAPITQAETVRGPSASVTLLPVRLETTLDVVSLGINHVSHSSPVDSSPVHVELVAHKLPVAVDAHLDDTSSVPSALVFPSTITEANCELAAAVAGYKN